MLQQFHDKQTTDRFHTMLIFVSGFVAGIWLLQQQAVLPSPGYSLAALPCLVLLAGLCRQRSMLRGTARGIGIVLLAGLLGFFYAAYLARHRLSDQLPKAWENAKIELVGVVASMPTKTEHGERFRFHVEQILTPAAKVPQQLALSDYYPRASRLADSATLFKAGQRWRLTVKLKRPHSVYNPHGFDFEAWALAQDIRAVGSVQNKSARELLTHFVWRSRYVIERSRAAIAQRLDKVLGHAPYKGVIRALVIGDSSQINPSDWQVFLRTGTSHLMSISGLHITMLAGLGYAVLAFFWRRVPRLVLYAPVRLAATIAAALVAIIYACLAGLSIPTQRTLLMLLTLLLALVIGRRLPFTHALALALLVVVLFDPWAVLAPGFWLSFSAVAFIAAISVNRLDAKNGLRAAVNTQWAVTIGMLPLLIVMFGQASIVSPIANAFAIPVISLLVVPLALAGSLIPIDAILGLANGLLTFCMQLLSSLASWPMAIWQQAAAPWGLFVLALLGVGWLLLPRGFPQRYLGLVLVLPMLCYSPSGLLPGEMQVTVLDVGQGLAVVVKTAGHTLLYDAGPFYSPQSDAGAKIVVPFLLRSGINRLDGIVISHHDLDHSGGLPSVLAQLPAGWLASSYHFVAAQQPQLNTFLCRAGQHWQWDGVGFEMLYPAREQEADPALKDNNRSCVLKVTSRHGTVLLVGDIERQAEHYLLEHQASQLKSDVLIVPHHGSKTSSSQPFIDSVQAGYIVFTVGYLNRFHHPNAQVIKRYDDTGAIAYRSDHDGAVIVDFKNGSRLQPQTWRQWQARYWQDKYL